MNLHLLRLLQLLQLLDHRPECLDSRSAGRRPGIPGVLVQRLAENDGRLGQTQQVARGAVQPYQAAAGVDDQQRIGHVGQNRFQLGDALLHLRSDALRVTQPADHHRRLVRQ